jgi:hypothetical protein
MLPDPFVYTPFLSVFAAFVAGQTTQSKNRSAALGVVLGLFFGIFGAIAAKLMKPAHPFTCPKCDTTQVVTQEKVTAAVCHHCKTIVDLTQSRSNLELASAS